MNYAQQGRKVQTSQASDQSMIQADFIPKIGPNRPFFDLTGKLEVQSLYAMRKASFLQKPATFDS